MPPQHSEHWRGRHRSSGSVNTTPWWRGVHNLNGACFRVVTHISADTTAPAQRGGMFSGPGTRSGSLSSHTRRCGAPKFKLNSCWGPRTATCPTPSAHQSGWYPGTRGALAPSRHGRQACSGPQATSRTPGTRAASLRQWVGCGSSVSYATRQGRAVVLISETILRPPGCETYVHGGTNEWIGPVVQARLIWSFCLPGYGCMPVSHARTRVFACDPFLRSERAWPIV
jgi:hypothetical protein